MDLLPRLLKETTASDPEFQYVQSCKCVVSFFWNEATQKESLIFLSFIPTEGQILGPLELLRETDPTMLIEDIEETETVRIDVEMEYGIYLCDIQTVAEKDYFGDVDVFVSIFSIDEVIRKFEING